MSNTDKYAIVNLRDRDPTINDDESDKYGDFRLWVNTNNMRLFFSYDQTAGGAIWNQLTPNISIQQGTMSIDDGTNTENDVTYYATVMGNIINVHADFPNTSIVAGNVNLSNVNPVFPGSAPSTAIMGTPGTLNFCYQCS